MSFEARMYRKFVAVLVTGAFAGIAAGALAVSLLGIELSGRGALWLYAGGGLLGVLIAAVVGWRTFEDV
ncbi:hypothetical protein P1P68_02410 [Streptomyces scabiei]|uniref:hypothetical protein n=1 Tax=Streptomyces scabiei TaxID=1930 RepID=UPI002990340D|nr:hypothetical protein [Streptomyces scabiei]MDW8803688.1 hypothetical protein [Streptomyces scabiei]